MTERNEPRLPSVQPRRRSYALLKQHPPPAAQSGALPTATPPPVPPKPLFTMNITAARQQSGRDCMDILKTGTNNETISAENQEPFCLEVILKPIEPGLILRPEETQLLLAYMGEILKKLEAEEQIIIEEEKAKNTQNNSDTVSTSSDEVTSCK